VSLGRLILANTFSAAGVSAAGASSCAGPAWRSPGEARHHALVNILQQDQNAVSEGRVEPMPFLCPRGE
jgi:hypothetical protein